MLESLILALKVDNHTKIIIKNIDSKSHIVAKGSRQKRKPKVRARKGSQRFAPENHNVCGCFGFDFETVYAEVQPLQAFSYEFGGRMARVEFHEHEQATEVVVTFDPETENPIDLQKEGWQSILNSFKAYSEAQG
jgi:hypothetical protein